MYKTMMECGHFFLTKSTPPKTGEVLYCRACRDYKTSWYQSTDYKIRCTECSYSRMCGYDKNWARVVAAKHAQLRKHVVKMFRMNTPQTWELVRGEQHGQMSLGDVAPY